MLSPLIWDQAASTGYHKPLQTTYIGRGLNLLTKPNTRQGLLQTWQIQTLFSCSTNSAHVACVFNFIRADGRKDNDPLDPAICSDVHFLL